MASRLTIEDVRTWDKNELIRRIKEDIISAGKIPDPDTSALLAHEYKDLLEKVSECYPWVPELPKGELCYGQ